MATASLERAERWRHDLGQAFGQLEAEAFDATARSQIGHGLEGSMAAAPLGRVGVFSVRGSPQVVRRTQRAIAAAPLDPLKICIQLAGSAVVHQADHEVVIESGQLALYDTGRPYDLRLSGHWRCAVVTVPRDAFHVNDTALEAAMRQRFSVAAGPSGLLASLTTYALKHFSDDDSGAGSRTHLGEAGIELVASLVDTVPHDDRSHLACARESVLNYVRAHLRDPDLSHATVAAAHHMSPRSLNRLFEGEDHTVTDSIRSMRLNAARSELRDPRWGRSSVMVVASRWGFQEKGHFTRAFKAEFGITPAAMRRGAALS